MAGFLYYVPGNDGAARAHAAARPAVFGPDPKINCRHTDAGPDGQGGIVYCLGDPRLEPFNRDLGYYPERQTWTPFKGFWLGMLTASPPKPAEIERLPQRRGLPVRLGDGQLWTIPQARLLPQRIGVDAQGELVGAVRAEYAAIVADAERVWKAIGQSVEEGATGTVSLTLGDEWRIALRLLSLNYYLADEEATVLGLLDQDVLGEALLAFIDWRAFEATAKALADAQAKKASAGASDTPNT